MQGYHFVLFHSVFKKKNHSMNHSNKMWSKIKHAGDIIKHVVGLGEYLLFSSLISNRRCIAGMRQHIFMR